MRIAKKRTSKVVETTTKLRVGAGQTQVGKSTNRTRGRCLKPAGKSEELLVEKAKHSSPSVTAEALCPLLLDKSKSSAEKTQVLPRPEQDPEPTPKTSAKIKLQLFPLDEVTRMGLEKDGYNPYLELTLSSRKKMSSVLKHLNCKWGGSSIAIGEPILFPNTLTEDLASCRWTLNDSNLTARDVHVAIGSPSIFRLRYGWLSDCKDISSSVPSTSTPLKASLQSKGMQKVCDVNKQIECNEGKMPVCTGNSYPWDDSLTNISIGGLLSEASLQGKFNNCDPKSAGISAALQPSQLISDSLDAFIMSQVNHSQATRLPSHVSSSSILDAEDTCHAFPFQKVSSLCKDALAVGGSAYSRTCSQDTVSKSTKYPDTSEVNFQSGIPQGHGCQESETDLSLCSRIYNDESSLGLSGIKWTDSLGPFDLGLSSSRKIISGDSLSFSKIIS
ncbi:hypothetical protein JCGZ_09446 [Jatropha curcas]|uniref:TSL-kinase interacting protein 1 n=1 Tax=Jatropha curcas TaxID=180498 RepID=A0A067KGR2_JATCU|nr:TSL-kinase interacting protein 1 [Jatropha curcas]XP_012075275.1 TSL-kinase interacting protein 1 [Jatropha curcas]XP_012075276.1 TSL-kinase interacting protein 1 [Jatropha curcas]XP_020535921.1 TSL-kinase interacting protein 1 [Jatropha curcas]XP_020535922.1 TSL-kinase interacting protein 1 [Jatropha curcas]XP_020535923.1 TSL-kinase interacting protein 1 [Jatropha curcas]XP_037494867.1 TSL-kinase interacting protein 1 [Jatropha curcas]KDP35287.1 hypothetical protein JCGZ_09446 [Jatropha 